MGSMFKIQNPEALLDAIDDSIDRALNGLDEFRWLQWTPDGDQPVVFAKDAVAKDIGSSSPSRFLKDEELQLLNGEIRTLCELWDVIQLLKTDLETYAGLLEYGHITEFHCDADTMADLHCWLLYTDPSMDGEDNELNAVNEKLDIHMRRTG